MTITPDQLRARATELRGLDERQVRAVPWNTVAEEMERAARQMTPHPFRGYVRDTLGGGKCLECGWQANDSIHDDPREGQDG